MKKKMKLKFISYSYSIVILKRIKEYPKVTHHKEKWLWTKNDI